VLVFDEIRTVFASRWGARQKRYGVMPDLTTVGKAMANGYAISAVVGRRDLMQVMEKKAFISSTFNPNSLEIVAALKTIEISNASTCPSAFGSAAPAFLDRLARSSRASGQPVSVSGIPVMPFLTFDRSDPRYKERRTLCYRMHRRGLFVQPYHHWYSTTGTRGRPRFAPLRRRAALAVASSVGMNNADRPNPPVAFVCAACSSSSEPPASVPGRRRGNEPDVSAPDSSPADDASLPDGSGNDGSGIFDGTVGGDRPVVVHVPPGYVSGVPAPLVIMLHGLLGVGRPRGVVLEPDAALRRARFSLRVTPTARKMRSATASGTRPTRAAAAATGRGRLGLF
jgi:hypothetical protein